MFSTPLDLINLDSMMVKDGLTDWSVRKIGGNYDT